MVFTSFSLKASKFIFVFQKITNYLTTKFMDIPFSSHLQAIYYFDKEHQFQKVAFITVSQNTIMQIFLNLKKSKYSS
jgi:hypothetical protein